MVQRTSRYDGEVLGIGEIGVTMEGSQISDSMRKRGERIVNYFSELELDEVNDSGVQQA